MYRFANAASDPTSENESRGLQVQVGTTTLGLMMTLGIVGVVLIILRVITVQENGAQRRPKFRSMVHPEAGATGVRVSLVPCRH